MGYTITVTDFANAVLNLRPFLYSESRKSMPGSQFVIPKESNTDMNPSNMRLPALSTSIMC
ncbi:unnamed protein product [Orchesella dallaii]|uniref:Uncharacterized protein n=1 Tax=Orchesella dallaii TaxID=48710 RepID=A0ABP1R9A8_9HEXA